MFCFDADTYIGAGRQSFKQEKVKLARNPQRVHQNYAVTSLETPIHFQILNALAD
jgi:hypothetical protein